MSSYNKIKSDLLFDNQVLALTLNAPKANVLDIAMISELTDAVKQFASDSDVKAIIFRAEGEHFSYGASIPEHQKEYVDELLTKFHGFFRTLIEISKPSFVAVKGQCLGGGLELAAFCNWIFAAENATFGQPEIKLAVFPPVASLILPYRIGQPAADDLILTGRSISAKEAKQLGLVYEISSDPEATAHDFIKNNILPKSTSALLHSVKSSRFEMNQAFLKNIDRIQEMYVKELMATEDANEGIRAFMEKRDPLWKNC